MLIKSFHLLSFVPRYLQTGKTMTESKCIRKYPKCLQSMKKLRVVDYGLTFPLVVTVITILNIPGVVIWGRTSMKVHFCLTAWHKGVTRMTCSFKSKIKLECGPGNFYQVKCNFTPLDMAHIWGGVSVKVFFKGKLCEQPTTSAQERHFQVFQHPATSPSVVWVAQTPPSVKTVCCKLHGADEADAQSAACREVLWLLQVWDFLSIWTNKMFFWYQIKVKSVDAFLF